MKKGTIMKRKDLVRYEGVTATVLKIYIDENTNQEYVQAITELGIIYDKKEKFIPLDCMLLRCNNCNKEEYEINIKVNGKMYVCECGSSTFTPLNLDLEAY